MEERQKSYYAIIPANVRYDKDLAPNAKLLYGEITTLCNEKGYCWASNQYFAELYGVSVLSIKRWVNSLVNKGYVYRTLTYKPNSKEVDKRILSIDSGIKIDTTSVQKCYDPSIKNDASSSIKNDTDNNTSINNINEYKEKNIKKESVNSVISSYTENKDLQDALHGFVEMRNKARKPLTVRAMKLSLNQLDKLAVDDVTKIAIVNQSIVHSWSTFYKLQNNNNGQRQLTRKEMGYAF
ncbi:MAG: helix-turn-helix domain-containing protein [Holdemanella biformis]|nr:helix-turn-helix domain-containing protein [Holdemanella biformis]MEE0473740.1 helix-turn-helix domain-containing protein [Holdemanella biformis]